MRLRLLPAWIVFAITFPFTCMGANCNLGDLTLQMLSNSGTSLNDLGNYDACLGLPNAHHCVYAFEAPVMGLPPQQTFWLSNPASLTGACVPTSCTAEDLRELVTALFHRLNPALLPRLPPAIRLLINATRFDVVCSEDRRTIDSDVPACIMVAVVALLGLLTVTATAWDWVNGQGLQHPEGPRRLPPIPPWLAAFSAPRSVQDLCAHRATPTDFLNGIRFFSIAWIVLGHIPVFMKPSFANLSRLSWIVDHYSMALLFGAFFAVDTFFFMSGFLQACVMPPYLMRLRNRVLHGLPIVYLLRYLRVTPLLLFLLYGWRITRYTGDGPVFHHYQRSAQWKYCDQYWWSTLLYVNDLYPDRSLICMPWTWYLSNDWQFFLLTGPLLLWHAYGNPRHVVAFLGALLLGCAVLGATAKLSIFNTSYFRPWNRCAPYIWGILAAMLLQRLRAIPRPPSQAVNEDAEAEATAPLLEAERPPRWLQAIHDGIHTAWIRRTGYAVAGALMWGGITLSYVKYRAEWALIYGQPVSPPWPDAVERLYGIYYVVSWGLALSLLLVPWALGYGGYVSAALGHRAFTPLARLTYGIYLGHPFLIMYISWQFRAYPSWTTAEVTTHFLAQLTLAALLALVLYVLVERPVAALVALIAPSKQRSAA